MDWWNLKSLTAAQRYVLASGYVQKAFRPRFNVAAASDKGDYTLYIFDVQQDDSGLYVCFEDLGLGASHGYNLTVSGTSATSFDLGAAKACGCVRFIEIY